MQDEALIEEHNDSVSDAYDRDELYYFDFEAHGNFVDWPGPFDQVCGLGEDYFWLNGIRLNVPDDHGSSEWPPR